VDEAVEIEPFEPVLAEGDRALPFGFLEVLCDQAQVEVLTPYSRE
jgi:hypothetical protein